MGVKLHQRYFNAEGVRLPGVTTLTGNLGWNTRVLMAWAVKETLAGNDYTKVRDKAGNAGTLLHKKIENVFLREKTDVSEFTKNEIKLATNSFKSFRYWKKDKQFQKITDTNGLKRYLLEEQFVSEIHQFGGTPDWYGLYRRKGEKDYKLTLLDWKSGNGIYAESIVQVAGGYTILLGENGYPVDRVILLNIPKTKGDSFIEKEVPIEVIIKCQEIMKYLSVIHSNKKTIDKYLKGRL